MWKGRAVCTVILVRKVFSLYLEEWFSHGSRNQNRLCNLLVCGGQGFACLASSQKMQTQLVPAPHMGKHCFSDCFMFSFISTPFSEAKGKRQSPPNQNHTLVHTLTLTHITPTHMSHMYHTAMHSHSHAHSHTLTPTSLSWGNARKGVMRGFSVFGWQNRQQWRNRRLGVRPAVSRALSLARTAQAPPVWTAERWMCLSHLRAALTGLLNHKQCSWETGQKRMCALLEAREPP